jgi:transcriptional regulator with XRE-family HTH domain
MDVNLLGATELTHELGARVRAERLRQNLTQHTLAERAGISRITVARIESTGNATLTNFLAVMIALRRADDLRHILTPPEPTTIDQFLADTHPPRRRGSR